MITQRERLVQTNIDALRFVFVSDILTTNSAVSLRLPEGAIESPRWHSIRCLVHLVSLVIRHELLNHAQ